MIAVTVDEIATMLGAELSGPGETTAVVAAMTPLPSASRSILACSKPCMPSAHCIATMAPFTGCNSDSPSTNVSEGHSAMLNQ